MPDQRKNVYILNIATDYYLDVTEELIKHNYHVKMIGINNHSDYMTKRIEEYVKKSNVHFVDAEDYVHPHNFYKIFKPDYSFLD